MRLYIHVFKCIACINTAVCSVKARRLYIHVFKCIACINIAIFLLKKCEELLQRKSSSHFFLPKKQKKQKQTLAHLISMSNRRVNKSMTTDFVQSDLGQLRKNHSVQTIMI